MTLGAGSRDKEMNRLFRVRELRLSLTNRIFGDPSSPEEPSSGEIGSVEDSSPVEEGSGKNESLERSSM
jgi:hypothetical protein